MNLNDVKNYIRGRDARELLKKGLQDYLQTEEEDPARLKDMYEKMEYGRIVEPVSFFEESIADILEHWAEYEWLYQILSDEKSRETLCEMLMAKLTLDTTHIEKAFSEEPIYFSDKIWGELHNEVFLDCGAYIGDTIEKFILASPDYRKIYAFEPVHGVMERCKKELEEISSLPDANIVYYEAAVSDSEKTVSFDVGSMNGESRASELGTYSCRAMRIDDLGDTGVSMIKMDIEGSEADAIAGAEKTIEKCRPKMAVCIYHKPGDFWKIPRQILSIYPEYRFAIRQHDHEVYSETVLYCIPPGKDEDVPDRNAERDYRRITAALKKLTILSDEEKRNWLQHGKDKKWFLYQLYCGKKKTDEDREQIRILDESKQYLKNQEDVHVARIQELEGWTAELEKGKAYSEEQLTAKDARITELEGWTAEQEKAKEWFLAEIAHREEEITALKEEKEKLREALRQEIEKPWHQKMLHGSKESDYDL